MRLMGQRMPVRLPRVPNVAQGKEVPLASLESQIETRTGRGCNSKSSSHKRRSLASGLLDIEPRLRRIRAHRHLARLREAIQRELGLVNTEANERTVA